MKKLVVASAREDAGKTTSIVGLGKRIGGKIGYMKPFGDRLYYKKKRLWDYDCVSIARIFNLEEEPEDMSIGFEHSKLMYMYNKKSIVEKIKENFENISNGKNIIFIEGCKNIVYGASVWLDSFSIARYLDAPILLILSGTDENIFDDAVRCKEIADAKSVRIVGAILNKVKNKEDWEEINSSRLEKEGIGVLGVFPYIKELATFTARFVAEQLFAKVVAGENGMENEIENVFIGAMSVSDAIKNPLFSKPRKLIITSGDRTDMIIASIEDNTSCIVLTNNIVPSSRIIEKADENKIPLLLVPWDTYTTAKKVERIKPWISAKEERKLKIIEEEFTKMDASWIDEL
ncbi:MAG TPA: hypothetical protein ENI52_03200 [Thermoplasmata archaeon]|nr:hypothetical protein [Thermoplasmata archaeon]